MLLRLSESNKAYLKHICTLYKTDVPELRTNKARFKVFLIFDIAPK